MIERKRIKRRRLPNGFGRITKLSNPRLRYPYRAMVTVGVDNFGNPIGKLLKPKSYFKTYNEAYEALIEYNRHPCDLSNLKSVKSVYEQWIEHYSKTLNSKSSLRTITSAWAYCSSVYDMNISDLRARHIKYCMEEGELIIKGEIKKTTPNIKSRIKSLFNLMLDYALEYELVEKNYARTFKISNDIIKDINKLTIGHIPFKDEEIKKLWQNLYKIKYVDIILIQCFTGFRPQELGLIEIKNVDLEEQTIIGGMKTEAGKNRLVPIHPKIKDLIQNLYDEAINLNSNFLINCTDTDRKKYNLNFTYDKYKHRFTKIIAILKLNPEHRPHDCRKHFVTMCKKYKVDDFAIKYIVGHSISDITEKVYTQRDKNFLRSEIEKIPL